MKSCPNEFYSPPKRGIWTILFLLIIGCLFWKYYCHGCLQLTTGVKGAPSLRSIQWFWLLRENGLFPNMQVLPVKYWKLHRNLLFTSLANDWNRCSSLTKMRVQIQVTPGGLGIKARHSNIDFETECSGITRQGCCLTFQSLFFYNFFLLFIVYHLILKWNHFGFPCIWFKKKPACAQS